MTSNPDEKLKILVVTAMYPHAGREGYGSFVLHQVEQLRTLGHDVDVLDFPSYRSKFEYLKAAYQVFRRTRRERFSVVHAHYGLTGITTMFRNSTPLVVTVHGSDALIGSVEPFITKVVCKMADATIVVSSNIARRITGTTIPCGVDLSVFEQKPKEQARKRLDLRAERKYVLFPFDPERTVKRFDLASAAVRQLSDEGMNVELLTVSKVHFREMPWYYSAADVMVLCSDSEGSPTSVKEALACNLPVVCTNVGDVKEITHGVAGVQIVEQSVDSLKAAIKQTLQPPEGFVFQSRSAMERYGQAKTVNAVVDVYRSVIDRRLPQQNRGKTPHPAQRAAD
jgi:teichuronic acid biosynthesis glycosyltransferase TuaC